MGVRGYTGEGCHLGGIIGIPWSGSETGFGVHVAAIRSFDVVFAAVVPAVGVAAGCVRGRDAPTANRSTGSSDPLTGS